jgi:hypothetical protein
MRPVLPAERWGAPLEHSGCSCAPEAPVHHLRARRARLRHHARAGAVPVAAPTHVRCACPMRRCVQARPGGSMHGLAGLACSALCGSRCPATRHDPFLLRASAGAQPLPACPTLRHKCRPCCHAVCTPRVTSPRTISDVYRVPVSRPPARHHVSTRPAPGEVRRGARAPPARGRAG